MQWSCKRSVLILLTGLLWRHDFPAFISPRPPGTIATVLSHPPGIRTCSLKRARSALLLLSLMRTWRFAPRSPQCSSDHMSLPPKAQFTRESLTNLACLQGSSECILCICCFLCLQGCSLHLGQHLKVHITLLQPQVSLPMILCMIFFFPRDLKLSYFICMHVYLLVSVSLTST